VDGKNKTEIQSVSGGDCMKVYRHKKTGNLYLQLDEVKNCTNANDGQKMFFYTEYGKENPMKFVREKSEFLEKFVEVKFL
jgi:hypothetical protein